MRRLVLAIVLLTAGVANATGPAPSAATAAKRTSWAHYVLHVNHFTSDPKDAPGSYTIRVLPRRGETEAQHEARADAKRAEIIEMGRRLNLVRPAGAAELQTRIFGRHITLEGPAQYEN